MLYLLTLFITSVSSLECQISSFLSSTRCTESDDVCCKDETTGNINQITCCDAITDGLTNYQALSTDGTCEPSRVDVVSSCTDECVLATFSKTSGCADDEKCTEDTATDCLVCVSNPVIDPVIDPVPADCATSCDTLDCAEGSSCQGTKTEKTVDGAVSLTVCYECKTDEVLDCTTVEYTCDPAVVDDCLNKYKQPYMECLDRSAFSTVDCHVCTCAECSATEDKCRILSSVTSASKCVFDSDADKCGQCEEYTDPNPDPEPEPFECEPVTCDGSICKFINRDNTVNVGKCGKDTATSCIFCEDTGCAYDACAGATEGDSCGTDQSCAYDAALTSVFDVSRCLVCTKDDGTDTGTKDEDNNAVIDNNDVEDTKDVPATTEDDTTEDDICRQLRTSITDSSVRPVVDIETYELEAVIKVLVCNIGKRFEGYIWYIIKRTYNDLIAKLNGVDDLIDVCNLKDICIDDLIIDVIPGNLPIAYTDLRELADPTTIDECPHLDEYCGTDGSRPQYEIYVNLGLWCSDKEELIEIMKALAEKIADGSIGPDFEEKCRVVSLEGDTVCNQGFKYVKVDGGIALAVKDSNGNVQDDHFIDLRGSGAVEMGYCVGIMAVFSILSLFM